MNHVHTSVPPRAKAAASPAPRRLLLRLSLFLFALIVWSQTSAAQTGVISGTVVGATSSSGIPSAQVLVTETGTRVITDGSGRFRIGGAEYMAELIDQRRRELFLEGQHLGDIIRYGIALQPAAGTAYHFGGTYGNQICFPLPAAEKLNNPLIGG